MRTMHKKYDKECFVQGMLGECDFIEQEINRDKSLKIMMPHIIGIIFGRLVLKLNPVLLFGALTGAGTVTPALNALKEEAGSSVPVLSYTVPYAFGNVILTIWGAVIINVM